MKNFLIDYKKFTDGLYASVYLFDVFSNSPKSELHFLLKFTFWKNGKIELIKCSRYHEDEKLEFWNIQDLKEEIENWIDDRNYNEVINGFLEEISQKRKKSIDS